MLLDILASACIKGSTYHETESNPGGGTFSYYVRFYDSVGLRHTEKLSADSHIEAVQRARKIVNAEIASMRVTTQLIIGE